MANKRGEGRSSDRFYFLGFQNHCGQWLQAVKLKDTFTLEGKLWQTYSAFYKAEMLLCWQTSVQSYGFSSSHVWMWKLDHKESWAPKNLCFQTVVLEKTLESPLYSKEIKPISDKGNQPWIFTETTDAKVEAPILWPPDVKSRLIGKDPHAGKDWGQAEKGATEDEMMALLTQWTWIWANSGR